MPIGSTSKTRWEDQARAKHVLDPDTGLPVGSLTLPLEVTQPCLEFLGGDSFSLDGAAPKLVNLIAGATYFKISADGGEVYYELNGVTASATSPGYVPDGQTETIGPLCNLVSLWTFSATAGTDVHVSYWQEFANAGVAPVLMRRFYVDATGGSDLNDGRSPDSAWQTIGKVNGSAFQPSDEVLFKAGETWTGVALVPPSSGTAAGGYIKFGSYGAGADPVIDGNDAANCVFCSGLSYLTFENLEATQGLDAGFHFDTCDNITVTDCDAHEAGNDNLLFITTCYDCTVTRGNFYNSYQRVPGTNCAGIEIADGCHDITLTDVTCYDNAGGAGFSGLGITIHSHGVTVMPYNITVDGATCYGNTDYGIFVWKQDNTADVDRNILLQDCHCYNNDFGIRIRKEAGALNFPDGITIDGCHCEGNTTYAYYYHGDNITMQRSVMEGQAVCTECIDLNFYNNSFYFTGGNFQYPMYFSAARTDRIVVKNNIVYRSAAGEYQIGIDATVTSVNFDIDYNLYYLATEGVANTRWNWKGVAKNWADWLADTGMDANSPAADQDPLFTNPGVDFTLQAGSPAIDAGVDVGLVFCGVAPDCGAYERC